MGKTLTFDMDNFRKGLVLLNDDSTTHPGSAREMTNVYITDRGGIAPRPGTRMLGPELASSSPGKGFYVFKKSYGDVEIPMRAYDDELEAYHEASNSWFRIMNGFTPNQEFGFAYNFVVTENEDYVYFCNQYQPYMRWNGQIGVIQTTLAGGETTVTVDTVLRPDIFSSRTASGTPTLTTVQQTGETWGTNQWRNMWVYFTSGLRSGQVRKIASNTADTLTFATLTAATPVNIASSTNASPIAITTSTPHGYPNGARVTVASHTTNTNANGTWNITVTGASTFTLDGSTGNGIGGATGTVTQQLLLAGDTFEIREAKFDTAKNANFIYNGTKIVVTGITEHNKLTVASAHAAPSGTPITNQPQEYPAAPRGNRLTVLKGRTFVSRVRSALSKDSGGTDQGSNVGSTLFGTNLTNPTDFTFSATRTSGQGIIAAIPFGGTEVNDIAIFEDVVYVYKRAYIEAFQMSETDDSVLRRPLKAEAGSINRVIVGRDDHYFITLDKQFTSLGRVEGKDFTPTTQNIGLPIKRLLDRYEFDEVNGIEYRNRIFFSAKSDDTQSLNNSTLVWNKTTQTFEGAWNIGAHSFGTYEDELYFQQSASPNVWRMLETKKTDFIDSTELPISAKWQSNFYNLAPIKGNYQGINSIAFEGYIAANAVFTVSLFKDFSGQASVEFEFGGLDDESFLVGDSLASFLGANPLALEPIGTVDAPGSDGRRRFTFLVYFPYTYGQYFSLGFSSAGLDQNWEIIRASLGMSESMSTGRPNIRQV
jgi:hypothetical protein